MEYKLQNHSIGQAFKMNEGRSCETALFYWMQTRTRKNIEEFGLVELINGSKLELLPPLPYVAFIELVKDASLVLTDSGGLQEETTTLGIPCFTLRENTERPVTIEEGTNTLVGTSKSGILSAYKVFKKDGPKKGRVPELWDGKTAERIVSILLSST